MDLRPRLSRWHHGAGGNLRSLAISSTTPSGRSTASSSGLGVTVGRTVAGAPSPQVPIRDTPCTSSSSLGSIGSPASNGTNPSLASPSAVFGWPQVRIDDCNSSGVESRSTLVYNASSRAPVSTGGSPLPNGVPCTFSWVGWPAPCWVLGPTFFYIRGGWDRSTKVAVPAVGGSSLASSCCRTWPPPSPNAKEVISAIVKQIRHKAAGVTGTPECSFNATAKPRPGRCRFYPTAGPKRG